jgi:hypothetical protein
MRISKEQLERMVTAFGEGWTEENRESDGMSRTGDRRRAGLSKALRPVGIEVDQDWRNA